MFDSVWWPEEHCTHKDGGEIVLHNRSGYIASTATEKTGCGDRAHPFLIQVMRCTIHCEALPYWISNRSLNEYSSKIPLRHISRETQNSQTNTYLKVF